MVDQPPDAEDRSQRVSDELERARAVAEVLRDQDERAELLRVQDTRRERRNRIRRSALVLTWAGVAYVWLASPSWLQVQPPPQPTVMEEARGLRLNMFFQSQKIEAYRNERGRLPYVLQETGPPFRGIAYRRRDGRFYELVGQSQRIHLRYESERPAFDFIGDAADGLEPPARGEDGP